MTDDPYDVERFVVAQDAHGTYQQVVAELRAGRKTSHWIWFIFPQIAGLGHSAMSQRYAITSLDEARAYLRHPVLGPRLIECISLLDATREQSAAGILGSLDAQKLQSSLTLFMRADPAKPVFLRALNRYFGGVPDIATERILPPHIDTGG
jgi:uncharacterized protein (DUF1810 family)